MLPESVCQVFFVFFFNDTATTEIYTLSLHDALPIFITTWGTIILLGLVVVFIFVGMLLALNLLNRTNER